MDRSGAAVLAVPLLLLRPGLVLELVRGVAGGDEPADALAGKRPSSRYHDTHKL